MFHISLIKNKEGNRKDVFHYPKLTIIPKINNDKLQLYCELYLYGDIQIPNNSLLLDLNTNFGEFVNIPLNLNYDKTINFNLYFESIINFNLKDNKELTTKIQQNKLLCFYPKLKIDANIFNAANLTPNIENVDLFIHKISFINEQHLNKEQYFYSNYYSLHDLSIKNIERNQINKPTIEVPIFNKTLNYNQWTNICDFINFYFINKMNSQIDWLELKFNYALNKNTESKKSFTYKYEMTKDNKLNKDSLFTNYDFNKNEIILSDKTNGYKGFFLPYASSGDIKLTFKIDAITYSQDFSFKLNQDLFSSDSESNAKFKIKIESSESKDE